MGVEVAAAVASEAGALVAGVGLEEEAWVEVVVSPSLSFLLFSFSPSFSA